MNNRPRIVFLYSEIAGYFLSSVKALSKNADILIVRWEVNKEAPFDFVMPDGVEVVVNTDYKYDDLLQKIQKFKPDGLVCSGWMDKNYLKIVKTFKKKITTILTLDNHWTGGVKQNLASILSPFMFKRIFTHAGVPGLPQQKFAKKLGFKNNILLGFYCADVDLYTSFFKAQTGVFKKQFLYVGRYVKHKGVFEMWQAFIELQNEYPNDWEMLCIGTGDEWDNRIKHDKIAHLGFVQPKDMQKYLKEKSVYVLPSKFEPWGVTVQEFAITSCPLILSKFVGASEQFLKDKTNGVLLDVVSVNSLKKAMQYMMSLSDSELIEMSQKSHQLGMAYKSEMWANRLLSII